MRRYRMMVYVPETMSPPLGGGPFTVTSAQRLRAVNAAARLPQRLAEASNGMATVDITIRSITAPLGPSYYRHVASGEYAGYYPSAAAMAQRFGEQAHYDFWTAITPLSMVPGIPIIPGLSATNTSWVSSSDSRIVEVFLHELLHLIGWHIEVVNNRSTGWPVCVENDGPTQGLHCALHYSHPVSGRPYPTTIDPDWLNQYASGEVGEGLGFTADKWSIPTPTESGLRLTPPNNRLESSVWGTMGLIKVPPVV